MACRYLYLTKSTWSLLQQHQSYRLEKDDLDGSAQDLQQSFPRISLISVATLANKDDFHPVQNMQARTYGQKLQVELYKRVTLAVLQKLSMLFNGWTSDNGTVCLFGIQISRAFDRQEGWIRISNITSLHVREGGGIFASEQDAVNIDGAGVRLAVSDPFVFILEHPSASDLTLSTMRFVMEFAKLNRQPQADFLDTVTRFKGQLELSCSEDVFEQWKLVVSADEITSRDWN
jgi:hypothetical protein